MNELIRGDVEIEVSGCSRRLMWLEHSENRKLFSCDEMK